MGAGWYPRLERFLVHGEVEHHFPREIQMIRYALRIAVDHCLLKARLVRGNAKFRRHDVAMEAAGITACQETPWSQDLDCKNSIERLGGEYDLESRGPAFSYTAATGDNAPTPQASTNVTLCWF